MSVWQSELSDLLRPTDLNQPEMESTRIRNQQQQQQQQQKQQTLIPHAVIDAAARTSATPATSLPSSDGSNLNCDRCSRPAEAYCPRCDLLACASCDTSSHSSSIVSSHLRVAPRGVLSCRIECAESHTLPIRNNGVRPSSPPSSSSFRITSWCSTCSRGVCNSCQSLNGVHYGHTCSKLHESFEILRQELFKIVSFKDLQQYRLKLQSDMKSLDELGISFETMKNEFQIEDQNSMTQILQRLNHIVQHNQTKLQYETERIEQELKEIETFMQLTSIQTASSPSSSSSVDPSSSSFPTPGRICHILSHSRDWTNRARHLVATSSSVGIPLAQHLDLEPLPTETRSRHSSLQRFPQLLSLLRVKDQLLQFTMASRKGLLKQQEEHRSNLEQLYRSSQGEIQEWMKLSEKLSSELRTFKQKCCFCQVPFSGVAASTMCSENRMESMTHPIAESNGDPNQRREGDGLHYFVPA